MYACIAEYFHFDDCTVCMYVCSCYLIYDVCVARACIVVRVASVWRCAPAGYRGVDAQVPLRLSQRARGQIHRLRNQVPCLKRGRFVLDDDVNE